MKKIIFLVFTLALVSGPSPGSAQRTGQAKIDSLLGVLKHHPKEDTTRINLYSSIAFEYYLVDPEKGVQYGLEGLDLARRIDSRTHLADMLTSLAVCYWAKSDNYESLKYFREAIALNEETGNDQELARCYGNIANVYLDLSDYSQALDYQFKALKISEKLGNKKSIAMKLGNIGIAYKLQGNPEKALEYYTRALKIFREVDHKFGISNNLGNIAIVYSDLCNYDKALEYHMEALRTDSVLGNRRGIASDLGNIGEVYANMGDYAKALDYHLLAIRLKREMGNERGMMLSLGGIADIYYRMAADTLRKGLHALPGEGAESRAFNLWKSVEYAKQAIVIGQKIGAQKETAEWYSTLAKSYKLLGNWRMAYFSADTSRVLNDSVFTQESRRRIADLESKRENDLKDKEIVILKTRQQRQTVLNLATAGGLLSMIIIVLLVYRNLRNKRRSNLLLQKNNTLITLQKEDLQQAHTLIQNEMRKASDYVLSLLPSRLAHGPFRTDYMYIPSSQLGGDSFGYHWIDDRHFAIYILDVCGHGISSALHSVSALNALRSARRLNVDPLQPALVAAAMNESFRMEDHGGLFFTLWYGVVSLDDGKDGDGDYTLSYICAGHPSPLVLEGDGSVRELGPPALAVGCVEGYRYVHQVTTVKRGSSILLFSDGTYEIRKPDGTVMCAEEFRQMIARLSEAGELSLSQVFQHLNALNIQDNYDDDFSLMLIDC